MLWPISIAVIVVLALGLGASARRPPQPRGPAPLDPPPDDQTPSEIALDDPLEALLRYGTPADAARLAEQGVDLAALGHRPPE
ncbi:MAG: hypothetical protein ABIP91_04355 [Sphingomicrobium sp.]